MTYISKADIFDNDNKRIFTKGKTYKEHSEDVFIDNFGIKTNIRRNKKCFNYLESPNISINYYNPDKV